mgnify:CR=1 FL=1
MDIAALSIVMNQSQLKQQASLAVMKSAMTTAETNAGNLIEMLKQSTPPNAPHPHLGGKIDVRA